MPARSAAERQWARQWASAATALAGVRSRELRSLSDDQALSLTDELLAMVVSADLPLSRRTGSGLVELQRLLHRARP